LVVNGSSYFVGNVGIGVSAPLEKMHIKGGQLYIQNTKAKSLFNFDYDQGNDGLIYYQHIGTAHANDGTIKIEGIFGGHTQSQGKASIDLLFNLRDGFLGLGQVIGESTASAIVVYDDGKVYLKTGLYAQANLKLFATGRSTLNLNPVKSTGVPTGTLLYDTDTDVHFVQDYTGNMGIGTTNPTQKLDVAGKIQSSSTVDSDAGTIVTTKNYVDTKISESASSLQEWVVDNTYTNPGERVVAIIDTGTISTYDGVELVGEVIDNNGNWGYALPTVANFRAFVRFSDTQQYGIEQDRKTNQIILGLRKISDSQYHLIANLPLSNKSMRVLFQKVEGDAVVTMGDPDVLSNSGTLVVSEPVYTSKFTGEVTVVSANAYMTHLNYNNLGSNFISMANSGYTHFRDSAGNTRMAVMGNGNIGIGTTTPTSKLQTQYVNATAYNTTFSDGYGYIASEIDGVSITNADTSILNGFTSLHFRHNGSSGNAAGRMVLGNQSAGNGFFAFQLRDGSNTTNTQEVLRIKSDGNIGIGTTTPAKKLDVAGDINFTGDLYKNGAVFSEGNFNLVGNSILGKWSGPGSTGTSEGTSANRANHYLGYQSGNVNTTGYFNTANGHQSLYSNTTGYYNTANGYGSLRYNTTGNRNASNGSFSLRSNTTGNYNTANGYSALYSNTTGNYNTANGGYSLNSNTTGSNNTANGFQSLYSNTTGNSNTANGRDSLHLNTTGYQNTANGYRSLYSNTTGYYNTANGYGSLRYNTTGNRNASNGSFSLYSNTTGDYNTANGY
jgi:hypothetical protein